uniref:C-type lectin domain-containing protein n=1 Tax=Gopherus evgoodei TaxID=1825980 RepID=A0A8C4Y8W8_9SAUR
FRLHLHIKALQGLCSSLRCQEEQRPAGKHQGEGSRVCTPCRRGWTFFQDRCYFHSCSLGTWDTANRSCASLGALLLQVTSLAEQAHIVASMKAPSFWMGLTDQALEGAWMWVDGTHSAANASYWQTGEPNGRQKENCALARQDGHWYDAPCTEQHHWVCEKEP